MLSGCGIYSAPRESRRRVLLFACVVAQLGSTGAMNAYASLSAMPSSSRRRSKIAQAPPDAFDNEKLSTS